MPATNNLPPTTWYLFLLEIKEYSRPSLSSPLMEDNLNGRLEVKMCQDFGHQFLNKFNFLNFQVVLSIYIQLWTYVSIDKLITDTCHIIGLVVIELMWCKKEIKFGVVGKSK